MKKILFVAMLLVLCGSIFAVTMPERAGSWIRTDDLTITVSGSDVLITWSAVPNAESYKVYSALTPEADFVEDLTGTFLPIDGGMSWSASVDGAKRFYHVTSLSAGDVPPMPDNFVLVEGGTFNNGTSDVTLSSFYMDKFETTQEEYEIVMGTNPSNFNTVVDGPVEQVSWYNAIEYCNRRSMAEGLTPCYSYSTDGTNPANWPAGWNTDEDNHINVSCDWSAIGYRLPSEAEWEYAARGGLQSQGYTYSGSNTIGDVAWYNRNSGNTTHTVGTKAANELGLYDMSGNVLEWAWDIYGSYPSGTQINPTGANSGSCRVKRGGGWYGSASICRVANRNDYYFGPNGSGNYIGFRLCRAGL